MTISTTYIIAKRDGTRIWCSEEDLKDRDRAGARELRMLRADPGKQLFSADGTRLGVQILLRDGEDLPEGVVERETDETEQEEN